MKFSQILFHLSVLTTLYFSQAWTHIHQHECEWVITSESHYQTLSSWIKLARIQSQMVTEIVEGSSVLKRYNDFLYSYDKANEAIEEIVEQFDLEHQSEIPGSREFNLYKKSSYRLIKAMKKQMNAGIDLTTALMNSRGAKNYKTNIAFNCFEKSVECLFYAIMALKPNLNRDKLSNLLKQQMMEFFYLSQSSVNFYFNPSERNAEIVNTHEKILTEYAEEIFLYLDQHFNPTSLKSKITDDFYNRLNDE